MESQPAGENARTQGSTVFLKLPGVTLALAGPWAVLALLLVLGLLAAAVYLVARREPRLWLSAVLWIVFIVYWSAAARNAAPAKASESPASRRLHQLLMYGALVLAFLPVPGLDRRWLPLTALLTVPAGLAVQAGSALLAVWARRHLGRHWSAAITAKVEHELIRTGPYRLIRHPIYSGMIGMLLGTAIASGELHGLLAVALLAAAYGRKIRLEEKNLRDLFGGEYDDYRKNSWALIPGLV
jgi:protein-S-isoprenylcysteine O-methyltransferase Ste14